MKLAFISPRYGAEIGSGPEHACRLFAEQLAYRHDIDVLTTCARDFRTWRNVFSEGSDRVRGVRVRRFAVSQADTTSTKDNNFASPNSNQGPVGHAAEMAWVQRRGPWSPGLVEYLANQYRNYDSLVFFSLHPAMIQGCTLAPDRTVVFPYLQPGPALRLALWRELLESVRGVGFFSDAERRLAHRYVGAAPAKEDVVGVGVEIISPLTYPRHQQDPADDAVNDDIPIVTDQAELAPEYLSRPGIPFRRQHRLYGPLATYVGRVEPDNGFEELFEYFDAYIAANGDAALGLFGVKMMKVPDAPFVRMAGVAPNQQRIAAFEAADVALIPSPDDLLSLPLLESLAVGTPILTSSRNATAVDHCRASNGGLDYANRNEFVECMRLLIGDVTLREGLGENGREYVRHQYNWEAVTERFEHLIGARKRRRH